MGVSFSSTNLPAAGATGFLPAWAANRAGFLAGLLLVVPHGLLTARVLVRTGFPAAILVAGITVWALFLAVSRRGLRFGLTLLGFSLFLFGTQSYVYPGVVFGFVLDAAAVALCWRNAGQDGGEGRVRPGPTGLLLAVLTALCLASTLLLPWPRLWQTLSLLGPTDFFATMAFSPADAPAYALAGAWRLAVCAVLARELARCAVPRHFDCLLRGVAGGLLTAIVCGLYEHFQGDHYLLHYRFTSLFANPGWFAEYIAVSAPFLLLFLATGRWRRVLAAGGLGLCAAALVLTLARAGWIAGSLTFLTAIGLYFRKNRLVRFTRPYGHLPTLAVAGVLLLGLAFWGAGRELSAVSRPINALLAQRVGNFTDSPRPALFRSGLLIAAERPVFGLGFASYARQYPVLLSAPGAWLHRFGDQRAEVFETAHSLYVQLLAGLGVTGLLVWLAMVGRAGWVLWHRARAYASLPDMTLLLSLAAFHLYAFFQDMFYVPPVFFLLFLPLARAMALEGRERETRPGVGWLSASAVGLALCGLVAYGIDAGLGGTAARLGLYDWLPVGRGVVFEGFYPPETGPEGTFRWSAGDAVLLVPPGTGSLTLTVAAAQPGVAALYAPTGLLGLRTVSSRPVRWRIDLPETGLGRAVPLLLIPARTYLPQAATGAPDPRLLGLAVGLVGDY